MSENTDKRNATQKIEDLEKVVTVLYQAVSQMKPALENLMRSQGDMALVKDALKLLNKKTEAIIQVAAPETGITVSAVSTLVVKMNVDDLTAQVAGYVANGHLVAGDEVADNSYLVCEESNADGTLANPRIQFRLDSQDKATADALRGKKAGDVVSFGENRFNAKILEVYTLAEPKAPEAATAPQEAAPAALSDVSAPQSPTEDAPAAPPANQVADATPALDPLPAETPVVEFVPSDNSTMTTASSR